MRRGNCYHATEALYHLLGGKKAGWTPCYVHMGDTHWFLRHKSGMIIDVTRRQFRGTGWKPDYSMGRGCGFQTKKPSAAARALMQQLVWQEI